MGIGSSRHQADGSRGRGDSSLFRKSSSATPWSNKFDSHVARKLRPSFADQFREICVSPNKGDSVSTNLRYSGRVNSSPSDRGNRFDSHIQKKRRLSSVNQIGEFEVSRTKGVSRLREYPQAKPQLKREVHAPARVRKFGSASNSNRALKNQQSGVVGVVDVMGNAVRKNYEAAKGGLLQALKYLKEPEAGKENYSDDSSVEVVENIEDDHEGRSVISDHRLQEGAGVVVFPQKIGGRVVEDGVIPGSSSEVSHVTKVEDAEKKLNSLSLGAEHYVDDVPLHKKLLESANRYNPKLYRLESDIRLERTRLESYRSLRPVKKPEEEVEPVDSAHLSEPFVPLSEEDEVAIAKAFSNSNRRKILVAHESSNIEITGEVLRCLRPGAWLNDEVINVYLELLKERERREPKKYLNCHFFNTFFYKKLIGGSNGYDYKSVRRWTTQRKLGYGLIECDKIFVPIHQEMHWCLAVIDKKGQKFQYLDSLGGKDSRVLKVLARYYVEEVKDKSGQDIDVTSWQREFVKDLPKQQNGSDCGVFMIKYSDFYSRGMGLDFSQEHMPYFRLRTAKEILQLRAD